MLSFIGIGGQEIILLLFVLIPWNLLFIIPLWQIFLALVPVLGLVVALFVTAYSRGWVLRGFRKYAGNGEFTKVGG